MGNENQKQKLLSPLLLVDVDIVERKGELLLPARHHQLLLVVALEAVGVAGPGGNGLS